MHKRFIEESFPVEEIGKLSSKEKNIRHGNISTLHVWWTRKPLASSRAVNYASLVGKPSDELDWIKKRNFIIEMCKWENSFGNLINQAKEDIINYNEGKHPKVLDPFSGGGSIPLEALRLGCDTYANDYNPVAVLIEKCTLEYPQIYGIKLIKELKIWGNKILNDVDREIGNLYPKDHVKEENFFGSSEENNITVGYLWVRTINCQNPNCEIRIPLITQYWLSKKKGQDIALFPFLKDSKLHFKIVGDGYEKIPEKFNPSKGTLFKANVTCPVCNSVLESKSLRKIFQKNYYNEEMLAVVSLNPNKKGKTYRIANTDDKKVFNKAEEILNSKLLLLEEEWGIKPIPHEETPKGKGQGAERAFSIRNYGINTWGELYNSRQKLMLISFIEKIRNAYDKMLDEGYNIDFAKAIISYLALGIDRLADFGSKICMLNVTGGRGAVHTFGRPVLPMTWTYFESNPFNPKAAGWQIACYKNEKWIEYASKVSNKSAVVKLASATDLPYDDEFFDAIFTDPPYYDNVPYSHLSDFFYVWLKRSLENVHPELFMTPLSPKKEEIVAYTYNKSWNESKISFEELLSKSFKEFNRVLKPNGIAAIVYAHKTTAGWETVINSILDSGLTVTSSWPISTEMKGRLRAQKSAALASSIYIIARKMEKKDIGWFKEVKDEIEEYVPQKLDKLWDEGISGADFFIAAIGSAIEIFGKYQKIMDNEGNEIRADKLLGFIRKIVTNYAVHQILHNGIADELSPLTKFYLLWRWNYGEAKVHFDEARKLAQSAGIDLNNEWNKGFIVKRGEFITVQGPDKRDIKSLEDSKELIDVIHHTCLLWKEGKQDKMKFVFKKSGYGESEGPYKVAQAVSETLPNSSSEKKMIEGFLASKDRIMQDIREDEKQTKLV